MICPLLSSTPRSASARYQTVFLDRFAEDSGGAGVGHVAGEFEAEEAHEGQPVGDWVLQPHVGAVVQTLQDGENAAEGLAPRRAFAFLHINPRKDGAEYLPVDDGIEPFQRVARFAQAGVAVHKVE